MLYIPQPIDTTKTILSPELIDLTERLAENTHAVWAQQRLAEGWTYGPTRDDARKRHPGLVAYADLDDAEKEYDRRTVLETLRLILHLGYVIRRPTPQE